MPEVAPACVAGAGPVAADLVGFQKKLERLLDCGVGAEAEKNACFRAVEGEADDLALAVADDVAHRSGWPIMRLACSA
jgi:hypothetical protein